MRIIFIYFLKRNLYFDWLNKIFLIKGLVFVKKKPYYNRILIKNLLWSDLWKAVKKLLIISTF